MRRMKTKILWIWFGLAWVGCIVFAATDITVTVPAKHALRVRQAMNRLAGKDIELIVRTGPSKLYTNSHTYCYDPKDPNETQLAFAERVSKANLRAFVRLAVTIEENTRVINARAVIVPPDVNVPDEIVE